MKNLSSNNQALLIFMIGLCVLTLIFSGARLASKRLDKRQKLVEIKQSLCEHYNLELDHSFMKKIKSNYYNQENKIKVIIFCKEN